MGGGNEKEGLDQNWCRSEIQFQRARGQVYYFVIFKITIIRSTLLHYTAHFVHRGEGVEGEWRCFPSCLEKHTPHSRSCSPTLANNLNHFSSICNSFPLTVPF